MKRLFVLRPEPAASRTVHRARSLGIEAVALPLFELEAVEWTAPDPAEFDALLLTSANAVNKGGEELQALRTLPVHAVGEATAVAAEVAGFGIASTGEGGIDDLLSAVPAGTRLLHLCGEDRRAPTSPAQEITTLAVYRARAIDEVEGIEYIQDGVAAVHSPRAARRLAELVPEDRRGNICIAAISEAAAEAVGPGWSEVRVARAPNDEALLALAARLCDT